MFHERYMSQSLAENKYVFWWIIVSLLAQSWLIGILLNYVKFNGYYLPRLEKKRKFIYSYFNLLGWQP